MRQSNRPHPETWDGEQAGALEPRWAMTRRRLLIGASATVGALVVGVPTAIELLRPRVASTMLESGLSDPELPSSPLVWFELTPAEIAFYVPKVEMGQGIHTALGKVAAEELILPLDRLRVRQGDMERGFAPSLQFTFGSSSVSSLYTPVREAAATVLAMLATEAARQLGAPANLVTADGGVFHTPDYRAVDYLGVVAAHTGRWTEPESAPALRSAADFVSIGARGTRVDMRAKLLGEAVYGYDARLPGLLYGAVALPPRFGATLVNAEAGDAAALPGVKQVVIDETIGFAGVVADTAAGPGRPATPCGSAGRAEPRSTGQASRR